ncbi:HD domain-containing protein [Pollutibacter soli]|uniref:HD domain-containing protein n=1 Tax=Pollutibacter soli TaxID=3034157 RepID=UPI003013E714
MSRLKDLSPHLTYHCLNHTVDVEEQCLRIAKAEGIKDPHQLFLLKIAAIYHDTGFLVKYREHEAAGCKLFDEDAEDFGIPDDDQEIIRELIMATKLPQKPKNLLEKVICDADLDYLGREDFFEIAETLHQEFLFYGIVPDDAAWENLQNNFLLSHSYHTESSRRLREPVKQEHIKKLTGHKV